MVGECWGAGAFLGVNIPPSTVNKNVDHNFNFNMQHNVSATMHGTFVWLSGQTKI